MALLVVRRSLVALVAASGIAVLTGCSPTSFNASTQTSGSSATLNPGSPTTTLGSRTTVALHDPATVTAHLGSPIVLRTDGTAQGSAASFTVTYVGAPPLPDGLPQFTDTRAQLLAVRFTVVNTGSTTIWGGHDDPTWSPTVIGSNGRGYGVRFGGILHPGEPAAAFNPSAGDGVIAIGDGTCTAWTETWYQTPRTSVSHCFLVTIPSGIKPTLIKMSFAATAGVTSTGEWSIP